MLTKGQKKTLTELLGKEQKLKRHLGLNHGHQAKLHKTCEANGGHKLVVGKGGPLAWINSKCSECGFVKSNINLKEF